jgi:hypothetical protein
MLRSEGLFGIQNHLHNDSESNVIGYGEITGLNALRIVNSLIAGDNKI